MGEDLGRLSWLPTPGVQADPEAFLGEVLTGWKRHHTVPEPFAQLIRDHLADLPNLNTAAHHDNEWLFPGGRPGQHIHQNTLMNLLRDAGINLQGAKNASLRALVLALPAP